ncbi:nucleoside/nucleotide kinase family protein [Mycobacterium kubicae]|uniref:nucleoside/nucleotide kinase family protein n=1 Tax=Mycobacterium kubicae TaxID=120959 RepID=UPI0013F4F0F9|nr:nucleoside/nucleotide kinase family protein [Mycobacterium kubicae]
MTTNAASAIMSALMVHIGSHAHARMIVGLAGPPGSGKSTLASVVVDEINARGQYSAVVMPMDGFHLSNVQLEKKGIAAIKGAPETFDVDGFIATLARIRKPSSKTVYVPDYSRVVHESIAASIAITPETNIVVLEGNYLLLGSGAWQEISSYIDQPWFLDIEWDVCRQRLIGRHIATGKPPAAASEWVDRSDKANYDLVVKNSRTKGVGVVSTV